MTACQCLRESGHICCSTHRKESDCHQPRHGQKEESSLKAYSISEALALLFIFVVWNGSHHFVVSKNMEARCFAFQAW